MNRSILFVDDDPREVDRFREVMGGRYIVGAGVTLEHALAELRNSSRVTKPDLILLDLYYGPETSKEMRKAMEKADDELSAAEEKVRRLLDDAGKSPNRADQAHTKLPASARALFSRKAFLKDALSAHESGLPLVEKPDPDADDKKTRDSYTSAMRRHADELSRQFDDIIYRNTFWAKHREAISGVWIGFLVSFGWDVFKGSFLKNWVATLAFLAGAIALTLAAWVARRL